MTRVLNLLDFKYLICESIPSAAPLPGITAFGKSYWFKPTLNAIVFFDTLGLLVVPT